MRVGVAILLIALSARAEQRLLDEKTVAALAEEISGETAKRHLEFLARQHRMRGSRQFRAAAEHIETALKSYGLGDAHIESLPADGRIFYGTQRSRPAWNAEFAELWDLRGDGSRVRLASWEAMPITLAQDSASGEATGELVDVGAGTNESHYSGKNVRGKLVLALAQPGPVARLAVEKYGAAGILSYAQNQRSAWWGENENLVRWGHLDTFARTPTFAFMVSLKQARAFQQRLAAGETVRLHAVVRAGQQPGSYDITTATIPGADPRIRAEEIIYSCHLDHPRPGANDNASGCAAILEVARALQKLIGEGRLDRPARTIRFVWPPEIEGTLALLNGRPEIARRIKAAIHLDMVGGGPETRAIFHLTRGPASLPSFVNDVAEEFGRFVNEETSRFARTGSARYPFVAAEGGKEPLQAEMVPFSLGSDHQVYSDSSFAIPAIYFNDWPDRYIHTNFDLPAHIDPTKLQRAAFIAAASGYFLASMTSDHLDEVVQVLQSNAVRRAAELLERRESLSNDEADNLTRFHLAQEQALVESISRFAPLSEGLRLPSSEFLARLGNLVGRPGPVGSSRSDIVYRRNPLIKGPMSAFGYEYLADKYGEEKSRSLRLLQLPRGDEYAYEILNLVDGIRDVQDIRDDVSAIYGPVSRSDVLAYLQALESIDVVKR